MKRYSYRKIPKYAGGSFLESNSDAIGAGGDFLADASGAFARKGKANVGLKAGQGALKGAAMGANPALVAATGGLSILAGAAIGGVTGLIGGKKEQKELERQRIEELEMQKKQNQFNSNRTLSQYSTEGNQGVSYYSKGGKIPKYPTGGEIPKVRDEVNTGVKMSAIESMPYMTIGRGSQAVKVPTQDVISNLQDPNSLVKTTRKDWDYNNLANLQQQLNYDDRVDGSGVQTLRYLASRKVEGRDSAWKGEKIASITKPQYKTGGVPYPEYEVEKDEVVQGDDVQLEESKQLSSDMQLAGGERHEKGGTMGTGGERVYSDRTKIQADLKGLLKGMKISLPKSSTYADVAKVVGTKKGKYEKDVNSQFLPKANSAKKMLERFDGALDATFASQEERKAYKEKGMNFKYGGIPKYAGGGGGKPIYKNPFTTQGEIRKFQSDNGLSVDGNYGKLTDEAYQKSLLSSGYAEPINVSPITSKASGLKIGSPLGTEAVTLGVKPKGSGFGDLLSENSGELMNAGNYLANLSSINKLDTSVKRKYQEAPAYTYTDRSGLAKAENQQSFRAVTKSLGSSSRGVNMSNIGAAYAATLDGNNKIQSNENMRKDSYDERYNQRADRTEYINNATANEASDRERDLINNKFSKLPLDARNALMKGIMGNKAMKDASDLDLKKAALQALANDNNGVVSRVLEGNKFSEMMAGIKNMNKKTKKSKR